MAPHSVGGSSGACYQPVTPRRATTDGFFIDPPMFDCWVCVFWLGGPQGRWRQHVACVKSFTIFHEFLAVRIRIWVDKVHIIVHTKWRCHGIQTESSRGTSEHWCQIYMLKRKKGI